MSGHKVRAENRDRIQMIKEYAKQKKFDILLVFMFDRIGCIADETPFVVEWFVRNGIRVWSAQEGEQRFETHTDKLTNYIRFWQADGESEKTSIRTSNSMAILTEQGCFTGGLCPYGYQFIKTGRTNKRKQEVNDLAICEAEAYVVRLMFRLAREEGYGAQRIANYLNAKEFISLHSFSFLFDPNMGDTLFSCCYFTSINKSKNSKNCSLLFHQNKIPSCIGSSSNYLTNTLHSAIITIYCRCMLYFDRTRTYICKNRWIYYTRREA